LFLSFLGQASLAVPFDEHGKELRHERRWSATGPGRVGCSKIMPTIAEVDGTRIMLFPFDHDPPQIHAFGADFRVKLAIGAGGLETRGTIGPAVMRGLRQ
jgi:hypothetical protein